uniref:Uncharacterized protein n=1 Tax=Daphnia galeata TaxID=27404 RepID=A0A8J2WN35_9CRUS|nr:unnamed protein product [Daphnia galeata]
MSAKMHHFATLVCQFVGTPLKLKSPCNRGGMKYLFVIPMKNTIWACQWLWMFPLATCLGHPPTHEQ